MPLLAVNRYPQRFLKILATLHLADPTVNAEKLTDRLCVRVYQALLVVRQIADLNACHPTSVLWTRLVSIKNVSILVLVLVELAPFVKWSTITRFVVVRPGLLVIHLLGVLLSVSVRGLSHQSN